MKKRLRIRIAIAAYNAEANITPLLAALLRQKIARFRLEQIIVYSDASQDKTIAHAKKVSERITVIAGRKRKGFAGVVKFFLRSNTADVLVLLNDDIAITDTYFIEKLLQPFSKNKKVGLVSGNPQPFAPQSFVEKAIVSSFRMYEVMRYKLRNGDNIFTCDGKVLALSQAFASEVVFPRNQREAGNVDAYLYLLCRAKKYRYRHVKRAKVYFKCPNSVADFLRWSTRNNGEKYVLTSQFGTRVLKEFIIPKKLYLSGGTEIAKNPFGCLFIFGLGMYSRYVASKARTWFSTHWETVTSTKGILLPERGG